MHHKFAIFKRGPMEDLGIDCDNLMEILESELKSLSESVNVQWDENGTYILIIFNENDLFRLDQIRGEIFKIEPLTQNPEISIDIVN